MRRIDLRRERRRGDDRVRAHPARLHAHRRRAARASGASSSTGSRRTTSRTRPRAGRSSTGTRTRPARRSSSTRATDGGTIEFASDAKVCIDFPARRRRRSASRSQVEGPEAVHVRPDPRASGRSRSAARRRCASSNFAQRNGAPIDYTAAPCRRDIGSVHMSRLRDERGGVLVLARRDDPGVPAARRRSSSTSATGTRTSASSRTAPTRRRSRPASSTRTSGPACITDTHEGGHRSTAIAQAVSPATPRTPRPPSTRRSPTSRSSTSRSTPRATTGHRRHRRLAGRASTIPRTPPPENESNITPSGGTWIDVKVKERDTQSLFGAFGVEPPAEHGARAGRAARGSAGDQFLPLAIPERSDRQGARSGSSTSATERARQSLVAEAADQPSQAASGMTLWGPDRRSAPRRSTRDIPFTTRQVPVPVQRARLARRTTARDYMPIGVELRLAGRPDINLVHSGRRAMRCRP